MALSFEIKTEKGRTCAAVTGYDGTVRSVSVPEYIIRDNDIVKSVSEPASIIGSDGIKGESHGSAKINNDGDPNGESNVHNSGVAAKDEEHIPTYTNTGASVQETHIPVTEISNRAFASRDDIESITLTDAVRKVRPYAFHNCHHLHYLSLTDNVVDYYDGAIRQCQELQEIEITFYQKGSFRLLKEIVGDSDAMVPVLIHFPVDAEHLRADEVLSELPDRAIKRVMETCEDGSTREQVIVTAALTFPSYADNYEEDTFSRALHEHIEGSGYATRQLVTRTEIDFSGYDSQFQRFTYDEPASAANAAFGRLMYPYRLSQEARQQYEEYLREQSPDILPRLIMGYKAERFGHEGELLFIPQDSRRTEERIRFMVEEGLISKEAIAPALEAAAREGAVTTSALLMDYSHKMGYAQNSSAGFGGGVGPETFEL